MEKKQEEGYKLLHYCVKGDSETTTYQQQKFRTNGEKFKHQNLTHKNGLWKYIHVRRCQGVI